MNGDVVWWPLAPAAAPHRGGGKGGFDRDAQGARDGESRRDRRQRAAVLQLVHVRAIERGARCQLAIRPAAGGENAGEAVAPHGRALLLRGGWRHGVPICPARPPSAAATPDAT